MMKRTLLTILCAVAGIMLCQAQIAGPWHGSVAVGAQKLPIVFNIAEQEGTYTATMDSPLQGAKGIPTEITVAGDTIRIGIPVIGAKYAAVHAGGVIAGTFEQRGMKFALSLEPGEYIPPRPQTPQPPYPYETREVTIVNPADGYELHGTLTLPLQYMRPGKKQFNAVVMVTGSGIQDRDEEIYGHRPFAVLAHELALKGIVTLRYDDRGYGDGDSISAQITTATNTADAKAALDYLRANVDRLNKVGVLGHSEGGTIAYALGADGDADFVVSLAGAAVRGDSILITQNERILSQQLGKKLTHNYIIALRRTLDYMMQNPAENDWPEIAESTADLHLPMELIANLREIVKQRNAWIDYFIANDPTDAIKHINVPVFAANGTLDVQVDSGQNLGALRTNLPHNDSTVIKEYPGLNHLMQHATTGQPDEYSMIEETIATELLQDIAKWIAAL